MDRIHKALRIYVSLCIYMVWFLFSLLVLPVCCLLALLPERIRYDNRWYFALTSWYARMLLLFAGIRFKVHPGVALTQAHAQPSVIIMNHTSALDIPLMEALLGSHPRIWISKIEYRYMPLIGFLLKRLHVMVNRNDARQATASLLKAYRLAQSGARHLVIFPEGTRHSDQKLHEFHKGFAVLAIKLNRPVVPIMVNHAAKVLPPRSWVIDSWHTRITLVVGPAMWPMPDQTPEQFALQVKQACEALHRSLS